MHSPSDLHPFPAEPLKILFTQGSDREIGRQHGEAVKRVVNQAMPRFYYDFWRRMLKAPHSSAWERQIWNLGAKAVDPVVTGILKRQIPDFARERLQGLAEGSGFPLGALETALVLPDLLPLLEVAMAKVKPGSFVRAAPVRFGCSSFFHRGKRFLHGRNLDFPGVGYWDRYPVLQVVTPRQGLRYIAFTTAGAPFGGITGVNEAQISVSLHQHYCSDGSLRGSLPFVIGERVLMEAKTLDGALEVLRRHRTAASWAFLISDGKSREAAIYESSPKRQGLNKLEPSTTSIAHSNFFQTGECKPSELSSSVRMNWDNQARKNRLQEQVDRFGNDLTPEQAVKLLSEQYDPYWQEEKTFNRTVSQVYNIQSILLDPENMVAWVAEGNAPVHFGTYNKYDLGSILSGRVEGPQESLPGFRFKSPAKKAAKQAYILSFVSAFDGRLDAAEALMDESLRHELIAETAFVKGILCMKRGAFVEAEEFLQKGAVWVEEKAVAFGKTILPPEYFETLLYLARCYDLMGKKERAKQQYQRLAQHALLEDTHVRKIALSEGPYTKKKLEKMLAPYSAYIPFD